MKEAKECTALVFDNDKGLFLPLAQRLAQGFDRVLYHTPVDRSFTVLNEKIIGDGFENFDRCDDIWKVKNEVDVWVFPDLNHSGLQLELESQGKAVWGGRDGDSLELSREKFHKILGQVGLTVPKFKRIVGLTKLREYLQDKENVYIKISKYRGSMETGKFRSMDADDWLLDVWAVKFGPAKELLPFLVFEEIETDLEIGCDTYTVDGQFPDLMINGLERKDKSYFGAVTKKEEMPDQIKEILEAFGPVLGEYRYRNQLSIEDRVTKDDHYFIDITCRGGIPSSASQYALWKNLPDIILGGARGEMVQPVPAAKFSVECLVTMKVEKTAWGKIKIDPGIRKQLHLMCCCEIDEFTCFPADDDASGTVGWLWAIGDTMAECVDKVKGYADNLPDGMEADTDALVDVIAEVHSMKEQDVPFTNKPVPTPESALNI